MKRTLEQLAGRKVPLLRVFCGSGVNREGEGVGRRLERQDRKQQDATEADTFWAGRTLAMRRSARVAA